MQLGEKPKHTLHSIACSRLACLWNKQPCIRGRFPAVKITLVRRRADASSYEPANSNMSYSGLRLADVNGCQPCNILQSARYVYVTPWYPGQVRRVGDLCDISSKPGRSLSARSPRHVTTWPTVTHAGPRPHRTKFKSTSRDDRLFCCNKCFIVSSCVQEKRTLSPGCSHSTMQPRRGEACIGLHDSRHILAGVIHEDYSSKTQITQALSSWSRPSSVIYVESYPERD